MAGAGARTRRKQKMQAKRKAQKVALKALYAQYAREGRTKQTKRHTLRRQRTRPVANFKHVVANCGNVGCKRCFPELNRPLYTPPEVA
jgi:hypothetical protein